MAYGTAAKLESRFAGTPIKFSATTRPTQTEVEEFIDNKSSWVDSLIVARYVVPVTGAASVKLLTDLVLTLVACDDVFPIVGRGRDNPFLEAKKTQLMWLKELVSGEADLPDASVQTSTTFAMSVKHNFDENAQPTFKVGEVL